MKHRPPWRASLTTIVASGWLLAAPGCANNNNDDIAAIEYQCGNVQADPSAPRCGAGDPLLPPEPTLPADPTDPNCILKAMRVTPPEGQVLDEPTDAMTSAATLDTARITTALGSCAVVKLVTDGANDAFLAGHIVLNGKTLWIDQGVTLFASRLPANFQSTGNCGVLGVNDSAACTDFITVSGTNPALVGDGTIDGQGGEPLVGVKGGYSWWQMSYALRQIDGSIGNPTLINTTSSTRGFLLYRLNIHNSPKFHVKITSSPSAGIGPGVCDQEPFGAGFIVWGITLLTPSKWFNSAGFQLTPSFARNTDGVDPGTTSFAYCGVIACNTISTGDDHIAIKGGHGVANLTIAHNHFGTGHGMSIGSETYGMSNVGGVPIVGVQNIHVYDLTVDADSRPVGFTASPSDFNGIRVKSDESRGGVVNNITYEDICMRDMVNAVLVSTAYNPLFAGNAYPDFRNLTFRNVHHVSCMGKQPPIVRLSGFNATLEPTITLDNFVIDNINPSIGVSTSFANIDVGPGQNNLMPIPMGHDVTVTDNRADPNAPMTPKPCQFPVLPAPKVPDGWLF